MSKHTPGPWRYELYGYEADDIRHAVLSEANDLWVAATYRSGTTANEDTSPEANAEAAANARLIAAAPDLLQFSIHMRDSFAIGSPIHMEACRLIAKATGEQA